MISSNMHANMNLALVEDCKQDMDVFVSVPVDVRKRNCLGVFIK